MVREMIKSVYLDSKNNVSIYAPRKKYFTENVYTG